MDRWHICRLYFHCLSCRLQNVSHENYLIFMRVTVQVTYIFIPIVSYKDSFLHRGKSKLGIGLFIHELLWEPLTRFPCYLQAPFFDLNVIYRLPFSISMLFTSFHFRFTCYLQALFFSIYVSFTDSLSRFNCYL